MKTIKSKPLVKRNYNWESEKNKAVRKLDRKGKKAVRKVKKYSKL